MKSHLIITLQFKVGWTKCCVTGVRALYVIIGQPTYLFAVILTATYIRCSYANHTLIISPRFPWHATFALTNMVKLLLMSFWFRTYELGYGT
jgi:hypothetical protein